MVWSFESFGFFFKKAWECFGREKDHGSQSSPKDFTNDTDDFFTRGELVRAVIVKTLVGNPVTKSARKTLSIPSITGWSYKFYHYFLCHALKTNSECCHRSRGSVHVQT
jgi:hypothetical protein